MGRKSTRIQLECELTDKIEEKLQQIRKLEESGSIEEVSGLYADLEKLLNEVSKLKLPEKNQATG